jgi:UDPglucose 6-dehydrogenase
MVLSACMSELGHTVVGICGNDRDAATLNAGTPLLHEPGLEELLERNLAAGRLRYATDARSVQTADVVFVSADTPVDDDDASDLSEILAVIDALRPYLVTRPVLCVTAQVPVGSTAEIARRAGSDAGALRGYAYVPEFLRLGSAVETFQQADRIVIGCDDPEVAQLVAALYRPLNRPLVFTGVRTAEMAKHASNAFLATTISFINEIAGLCEQLGADASDVAQILKLDHRIGPHAFLTPGLGFAGGTLGREIRALQQFGRSIGTETALLDAVWNVNERRASIVTERLEETLTGLRDRVVTLFGLTYKPGTSTLRGAISLTIAGRLQAAGARVRAYDPLADLTGCTGAISIEMAPDPYSAAHAADAVVLLTEWAGIEALEFDRLRRHTRGDVFFDTRNLFDPALLCRSGFRYFGIGRP